MKLILTSFEQARLEPLPGVRRLTLGTCFEFDHDEDEQINFADTFPYIISALFPNAEKFLSLDDEVRIFAILMLRRRRLRSSAVSCPLAITPKGSLLALRDASAKTLVRNRARPLIDDQVHHPSECDGCVHGNGFSLMLMLNSITCFIPF